MKGFLADITNKDQLYAAIDDINKQKITDISKKMLDKKYLAQTQFSMMMSSLMATLNSQDITQDVLVDYLETLSMTIDMQDVNVLQHL